MLKLNYSETIARYYFSKGKDKRPIEFKTIEVLGTEIDLGFKKTAELKNTLSKEALKNSTITTILGYANLTLLAYFYFTLVISIVFFTTSLVKELVFAFLIRLLIADFGEKYYQKTISSIVKEGWRIDESATNSKMSKIDAQSEKREIELVKKKLETETKKGATRGWIALGFFLFCIITILVYIKIAFIWS